MLFSDRHVMSITVKRTSNQLVCTCGFSTKHSAIRVMANHLRDRHYFPTDTIQMLQKLSRNELPWVTFEKR